MGVNRSLKDMGYRPVKPPPPPSPPPAGQGLPKPPKGGTGVTKIKPQQYECEYCGTVRIIIEDKCESCGARRVKLP